MGAKDLIRQTFTAEYEVSERRAASGTARVTGYASVFSAPYEMHDFAGKYSETVLPGAFSSTLASDPLVVLLANHDGLPLASTRAGTLQLVQDSVGLRVIADVDLTRVDSADLVAGIRAGAITEMSFGFRINRQEWDESYENRYLVDLDLQRGDVAIVTYGASPHTSITA